MMKIIFDNLQFEVTRKCNLKCMHCCRGDEEDLSLTKEIVDAFFDNNDIYSIGNISFSGGEPTLNAKIILYIVNKIIENNIILYRFIMSINGQVKSEDLKEALIKLNEYAKKFHNISLDRYGLLFISESQYHLPYKESVRTFYHGLPFFQEPTGKPNYIESENLLPYGRAYINNLSTVLPDLSVQTKYDQNYKLKEYEGENYFIIKNQYISSNGNVLIDGCVDYQTMDKVSLGNVCDKPFYDMYQDQEKIKQLKKINMI